MSKVKKFKTSKAGLYVCELDKAQLNRLSENESSRKNRIYDNHSVRAARRTIEQTMELPKGSVRLVNPEGEAVRADMRIATLRRLWK